MARELPTRPRIPARPAAPAAPTAKEPVREEAKGMVPSLFYLFIEFARPQAWVPALGLLKPGMLAAAWGLGTVFFRRTRPIPKPIWAMIAFAGVMAWNVPWAVNNAWALWGFEDFSILILGCVLPLAVLPTNFRAFRILVSAYVFLHVPMAVNGLLHAGRGQGGWVTDENDLALALNAALGVAVFLFMESNRTLKRWLLLVSMALFVAGIVSTMSRGGFVGLASLGLFLFIIGPRRGTIFSIFLVATIALFALAPPQYWHEVGTIETSENRGDTGEQRLYFWGLAWKMYLDHPITGVGARNYGINAPFYEDPGRVKQGFHTWGRVCHSLYFTLLSEESSVGVILFAYILWWCIKVQRRLRREFLAEPDDPLRRSRMLYGTGLASGLFGYLISAAFLSALYYPVFWVFGAFFAVLDAVAPATAPARPTGGRRR